MNFGKSIITWYHQNKRDLPWRNTTNPYFIWLSEVILQQTRVDQGLSYYLKFIKAFPTVKKLAAAHEETVLKLWQGLGYYSRARNLHQAAKQIVENHGGKFPETYEEIRSLKGVGAYTAAAVSSFAFNKAYPVVDGNVYRVLSRYLGIAIPINSTKAKKEFTEAAALLMRKHSPHDFNQAIMEFGARQCKPRQPMCDSCPLSTACYAFGKGLIKKFPVKKKDAKPRLRYFHYVHITQGKYVYLNKRNTNDIWKNLYEFPMVESEKKMTILKLLPAFDLATLAVKEIRQKKFKHLLSHQTIHASFLHVVLPPIKKIHLKGVIRIKQDDLDKFPIHRLMEKYLESL